MANVPVLVTGDPLTLKPVGIVRATWVTGVIVLVPMVITPLLIEASVIPNPAMVVGLS